MAIPLQTAALLADENNRRPFSGRLLQLGRQSLFFEAERWNAFQRHWHLDSQGLELNDEAFFRALGFAEVESLDVSTTESPSYVVDLNASIPANLVNRFDVVYDGGTIEHVFNVAQVFESVVRMLRVGGRAIHIAVASNYVDHGFYQFSPTLFADFYAANGFQIENALLIELLVSGELEFLHPWQLYQYTSGSCDHFNSGAWGFSRWPVAVWFVARKLRECESIVVPRQSVYSRWSTPAAGPPTASRPSIRRALKRWFRPAYLPLVKLKRILRTPRPPYVGSIDSEGTIHWKGAAAKS